MEAIYFECQQIIYFDKFSEQSILLENLLTPHPKNEMEDPIGMSNSKLRVTDHRGSLELEELGPEMMAIRKQFAGNKPSVSQLCLLFYKI